NAPLRRFAVDGEVDAAVERHRQRVDVVVVDGRRPVQLLAEDGGERRAFCREVGKHPAADGHIPQCYPKADEACRHLCISAGPYDEETRKSEPFVRLVWISGPRSTALRPRQG